MIALLLAPLLPASAQRTPCDSASRCDPLLTCRTMRGASTVSRLIARRDRHAIFRGSRCPKHRSRRARCVAAGLDRQPCTRDGEEFDDDRDAVLARAFAGGVEAIVAIGAGYGGGERGGCAAGRRDPRIRGRRRITRRRSSTTLGVRSSAAGSRNRASSPWANAASTISTCTRRARRSVGCSPSTSRWHASDVFRCRFTFAARAPKRSTTSSTSGAARERER